MLAALALAALPIAGSLVPGTSLGGIRIGDSAQRVVAQWGHGYGRCSDCKRPTWYFNYVRYAPQGAGVEFDRGRVSAVFTLWSPTGWHTADGVRTGDPVARVTASYGHLRRMHCGTYDALLLSRGATTTSFYVVNGKVWGFGLSRRPAAACR